jgi:nicotinamidase-related amidase
MSTLENRPNTALLVVDVQTGVVKDAYERGRVIANIGSLVEKARRERVASSGCSTPTSSSHWGATIGHRRGHASNRCYLVRT